MMFTCMLLAQYAPALWAADKVRNLVTRNVVSLPGRPKLTPTVEGYHAMRSHVLERFGRWQDILHDQMLEEPELYVLTPAVHPHPKPSPHPPLRHFPHQRRDTEL